MISMRLLNDPHSSRIVGSFFDGGQQGEIGSDTCRTIQLGIGSSISLRQAYILNIKDCAIVFCYAVGDGVALYYGVGVGTGPCPN